MLFAADLAEATRHPLVVGLLLFLIPALAAVGWKVWRGVDALLTHVLPHFLPPKPGDEDTTLPARVKVVQERQEAQSQDLVRLDLYMHEHVRTEESNVGRIDGRLAKIEATTDTTARWVEHHTRDAARRDEAIARHDERLNALEVDR